MRVVGLISGGKDSCYNLLQCIASGHEIVALANLKPKYDEELNSYMYQSAGHMGIDLYAEAMELPLYRKDIEGSPISITSIEYSSTNGDEVEDLYSLLEQVKNECSVEAVSVGAVLSHYQRVRVENVCQRLGLIVLAYLWERDQSELLQEMIDCGIDAIIIKVASLGLDPLKHLGKTIKEMQPYLENMKEKYNLNVCGEGGEYETFTLDCPLFKKRIFIEETELSEMDGDVGYLKLKSMRLISKDPADNDVTASHLISKLGLKRPNDYICDTKLKNHWKNDNMFCSTGDIEGSTLLTRSQSSFFWASASGPTLRKAFGQLKDCLESNGFTLRDIIGVKLFVRKMEEYASHNVEYVNYFDINPPTRACIEVPFDEEIGVSLEVVACKDSSGRKTLHVQSMSHWAPANIGPYSQAIKVGSLIMVAGMIGLVPGNLEIPGGGIEIQAKLSLRHIHRVLKAIDPRANVASVVQGVCYITSGAYLGVVKEILEELSTHNVFIYVVVSALPKFALVEWHLWAHLANPQFDAEEMKYSFCNIDVIVRRRYSVTESVYALVANAYTDDLSGVTIASLAGILQKCAELTTATEVRLNMTLYYKAGLRSELVQASIRACPSYATICAIPVVALECENAILSLAAVTY